MAWFKVDDGLHDHRKARKVRRSHSTKRRDASPFGIWVLAGSWAGANGTSGFVPTEILEEWDDDAEALAARLVDAGLWWPTVQDGEPGYGFHDWDERNPVNEVDSGRFGNHLRWHVNRGVSNPDCEHCVPPNRGDDRGDSGTTSPPDSSPVPTRPDQTKEPSASADAERDGFEEFWTAYPRKKDKGHGVTAYRAAVKRADHETIMDALERAKTDEWSRRAPEHVPYPATWLRSDPWDDEPDEPTVPQRTPFPRNGTREEQDAWVAAQPPVAWVGG